MKLQQFEGGVANRLAPQLLNNNQGVVYENIDNASGVLTPVKDKLATEIAVTKYNKYFNAESEWLSADAQTDFLEFQSKMYLADRINRPQKYSNRTYNFLGIEGPVNEATITNTAEAIPLTVITALNKTDVGDLPGSELKYALFNIKDGIYSVSSELTVAAAGGAVTVVKDWRYYADRRNAERWGTVVEDEVAFRSIEFKDIVGNFGDSAKLFRLYKDKWRLLYTFADETGTFTDSTYDIATNDELNVNLLSHFNGVYQYVYTYYNSNDGTESIPSPLSVELTVDSGVVDVTMPSISTDPQVTHKRLYRVGGDSALFTMVTEVPATATTYKDAIGESTLGSLLDSENFYEAPAGLQYLTESYAMLFGAVGTSLRFTPIGNPNAWPPEYEIQFEADITGLGPVANGILVFTRTKTYIVTGTGPLSLAQQSLRGDQGCIAFESIAEATEGTLIWASEDGLCTSSGNNVRSLTKSALGNVELDPVSSAVNDEVYYCHNADGSILSWDYRFGSIPKWLKLGTETLSTALGKLYGYSNGLLHLLFEGTTNLTLKYKSPRFVEGSFSEQKTYKKVYIRSEGDIIIGIIIDDEEVARLELTGKKTHQLQVPQIKQRGYSIQFDIEGTGTIDEIEYVATQRQND